MTRIQAVPGTVGEIAGFSRRQLLAGLAAVGAGALLRGDLHAQAQRSVIDVHHHIVPPKFMAAHRDDMVRGGAGQPYVQAWTPQVSLDQMDAQGVATSILSLSTPGTWFGSVQDGRKMSRIVNDYAAELARDHPGRFGLFAAIPVPDIDGTLKEIEYAFDVLKADGVGIMTSYDTIPTGDKSFWPVFEELNRRKAVVFMHRTAATCCLNLRQDPANQEFIVDDVRALNSFLVGGTLVRFPDVRLIHSHGDKVMAWVAKLNGAPINGPQRGPNPAWAPQGIQAQLRTVHVDSAGNNKFSMDELRALGMLGNRVMFGTDVPWGNVKNNLDGLRQRMGCSPAEVEAVEYKTARALFPKYNV